MAQAAAMTALPPSPRVRPRALLAPLLLALVLLLGLRVGAMALRHPNPGMTGHPCPPPPHSLGEKLRIVALVIGGEPPALSDWPALCVYAADNARLIRTGIRPDVVFIGDSITQNWAGAEGGLFSDRWVNRGIGGQTSQQVLARFPADALALHPRAIHLQVGLNDIAGNTGPVSPETYRQNIRAMVSLARANGIGVVIGAITPSRRLTFGSGGNPARAIRDLNRWLAAFAASEGLPFIDYHTPLAAPDGGLKAGMGADDVHLSPAGYRVMAGLMRPAVGAVMRGR